MSGAPYWATILGLAPLVLCKNKAEVADAAKHSSLLQHGINYGRKKFYSTGARYLLIVIRALPKHTTFINVKFFFVTDTPGACTTKLFTTIITDFCNKLKCLSLESL